MDFITIGGQERPFRCSWLQLKAFARKKGIKKLGEIGQALADIELDEVSWLTHKCLQDGAKRAEEEFNHTVADVDQWFDEDGFEKVTEVFTSIAEGLQGKQEAEEVPPLKTLAEPKRDIGL